MTQVLETPTCVKTRLAIAGPDSIAAGSRSDVKGNSEGGVTERDGLATGLGWPLLDQTDSQLEVLAEASCL